MLFTNRTKSGTALIETALTGAGNPCTIKDWLKVYCPNIYIVPVYSLNSVIELGPACVVHVDDAEAERSKD